VNAVEAWLAGNPLPWSGAQRLQAGGVPWRTIGELNGAGLIGAARVHVSVDGSRFEPEGPDARLLLGSVSGDHLVDVVAMSTTCEDEWAVLTGGGDILGQAALDQAVATNARFLRLHATPMAWLRAGCEGVAVVQWNKAALSALRGLPEGTTLVVDPGARDRLRGLLQYGGLPQVAEDRPNWGRAA
jgi:hypothetical protein